MLYWWEIRASTDLPGYARIARLDQKHRVPLWYPGYRFGFSSMNENGLTRITSNKTPTSHGTAAGKNHPTPAVITIPPMSRCNISFRIEFNDILKSDSYSGVDDTDAWRNLAIALAFINFDGNLIVDPSIISIVSLKSRRINASHVVEVDVDIFVWEYDCPFSYKPIILASKQP